MHPEINLDIDGTTNDRLDVAVANFTESIQKTVWTSTKTVTNGSEESGKK